MTTNVRDRVAGPPRGVLPVARHALTVVSIGLIAGVVWRGRAELPRAAHALREADAGWLAVGAVLLVVWWLAWLLVHVASRRVAGVGGYREVLPLAAVSAGAVALNLAVKSGALAGLALFARHARQRGQSPGRVAGAYLLAVTLMDVAFAVVLAVAVVVATATGSVTGVEVAAAVVFGLAAVARVAVLTAAAGDRRRLRRLWTAPRRWWDRLRRRPGRRYDVAGADDLYDALALVRGRPVAVFPALAFALGVDLLGAAMLWASLAAVGGGSRPAVALVAYAMSGTLGIVGFLPGGVGFVEIGATAVLTASGVPLAVAAASVVLFRIWEFWLPLLVGGLLALRLRAVAVPAGGGGAAS